MTNFLENPEQAKAELKDKWLDWYEANRQWLKKAMDEDGSWYDSVYYQEKKLEKLGYRNYSPRRPSSLFIMGVITNLEPQLRGLLALSPDCPDSYIERLGLDIDPDIELKRRSRHKKEQPEKKVFQELEKIREELKT